MRLYAIVKTDIDGHAELKSMAASEKQAEFNKRGFRNTEVERHDILVLDLPTLEEYKEGLRGSIVDALHEPPDDGGGTGDSGPSMETTIASTSHVPTSSKPAESTDYSVESVPVIESPDPEEKKADAAPKPKPKRKS